jgi:hypothetical protein
MNKKAQVSFEYLVIMGFVTVILILILSISIFYSSSVEDQIKVTQMNNYANKIISSAESVFYSGKPSKATITAYLPKDVKEIEILDNSLVISIQTSNGINKRAFESNVPISGNLTISRGLKKIKIEAQESEAVISQG